MSAQQHKLREIGFAARHNFYWAWLRADIKRLEAKLGYDDEDPTPFCHICHALTPAKCRCGAVAENR